MLFAVFDELNGYNYFEDFHQKWKNGNWSKIGDNLNRWFVGGEGARTFLQDGGDNSAFLDGRNILGSNR